MPSLEPFYQAIFEQHHDESWDRAPGKDVVIHALQQVASKLSPESKLIDIGCGTGFLLNRVAREVSNAWSLYGVDFAPNAIARGAIRYPHLSLSCQDGTATTFNSATFDAVASYGAIEHFPDPAAALREVARILKPGGYFIIMLPTLGAYRSDRADEGWYEDLTGQPQWNLTRDTWNLMFAEADLALDAPDTATVYGAKQPHAYFIGSNHTR